MIKKCAECKEYTLKDNHCDVETKRARPPKFSYPDKYGKYRRQTKKDVENE